MEETDETFCYCCTFKDIWTKVREKPEFLKYVRENVEVFLKKPEAVTDLP